MNKILVLALFSALLISGCKDNMQSAAVGDAASSKKVIIASDTSDFKKEVVTKVTDGLVKDGYYLQITGLDELKTLDSGKFGAIVILNPCWAGSMDNRVSDFMKSRSQDKKIIIFTTAGNGSWKPDLKVDVVSGASNMETADSKAKEIISLVKKRF